MIAIVALLFIGGGFVLLPHEALYADEISPIKARSDYNDPWVKAFGQNDCNTNCKYNGYKNGGYFTGYYKNTERRYYVCAYYKRGYRPGWNMEGEGSCRVGTGSNAEKSNDKYCLCDPRGKMRISFTLIEDRDGRDYCNYVCQDEGLKPVETGKYTHSEHYGASYYVCAANAWGRGWRGGFNLHGERKCIIGSGGRSVYNSDYKYCLCYKSY